MAIIYGPPNKPPIKSVLILLFGLLIFLMRWGMGRDAYKKKQEEELNKMKTQGIKKPFTITAFLYSFIRRF